MIKQPEFLIVKEILEPIVWYELTFITPCDPTENDNHLEFMYYHKTTAELQEIMLRNFLQRNNLTIYFDVVKNDYSVFLIVKRKYFSISDLENIKTMVKLKNIS